MWAALVITLAVTLAAGPLSASEAESLEVPVAPIDWAPCDAGGECGTYRVPLDHAQPTGPEVSLALWRAPATGGPAERIGSLFVNPGGPGTSGIDFAQMAAAQLDPSIRARFDVVGFDPRGVGRSSPAPECPGLAEASQAPANWDQFFAEERATGTPKAIACAIATGRLRDTMGTTQVAADLDLLRRAVGDERLTYWGGSYGTRIGYTYAALYPDRVRALVLDGAVDPGADTVSFMYERGGSYDAAYQFFRSANPQAAADIDAVLAAFAGGAEVIHLDGADITIDAARFLATIQSSLSSEDAWPSIAEFVADARASIVEGLPVPVESPDEDLAPDPEPSAPAESANFMTVLRNVNCVDMAAGDSSAAPQLAAEMVQAGPLFGASMASGLRMCDDFPAQRSLIPTSVTPAVPAVLVIGSVHDPATPYPWAQRMQAAIPGSRLVTYGGVAHVAWNFTRSSCLDAVVDAYVLGLTVPADDLACPFASPFAD